jgi:hypothetical protein
MAKNLQYGRLRAVALQVVMWLIFGASLGLAAYIDHRRSGSLDVELAEPRAVGRLVVRLPNGWELKEEGGPPQALVAEELDRQGRLRRTLKITQEQQTGRVRGPEYYLESVVNPLGIEEIAPEVEPFRFLGQDDAVLMAMKIGNTRALRRQMPAIPEAGVYACAVLPDGLTVTVQVMGDGAFGPSSRQLLRLVADSIKPADKPATRGTGG